jgi:pimeloyl-ACP methyl ester carboxylesterase
MAEPTVVEETLAYYNPLDGTGPLHLLVALPRIERPLPLLIVMHGYSQGADRNTVASVVLRLAELHELVVAGLDLRGRGGSAGVRDSGGREVSDIHAACEFLCVRFGYRIDRENLAILGYSGGGGNVFSVLAKCPGLFRSAFSFFGISDYAYWFDHGAEGRHRAQLTADVGGHPGQVLHRYAARNSLLGVANSRLTDVHLFWDAEETVCPAFFNRAFAREARRLGQDNVTLHESRPGDRLRWHHGYPGDHSDLVEAEPFIAECVHGPHVPAPVLPPEGSLTVVGYLITGAFTVTLGDLTDSVAHLEYDLSGPVARFKLAPQSAPPSARACIRLGPWTGPGQGGELQVAVRPTASAKAAAWEKVRRQDTRILIEDLPLTAEVTVGAE